MEVRQLRYFVEVAEQLHFSRAAARLHVAQSALSRQIVKLEREVGCRLLVRSTRTVTLTAAGRSFLADARELLRRLDRSVERARLARDPDTDADGETLAVGLGLVMPQAVAQLLSDFQSAHADTRVELHELYNASPVAALRDGLVDVIFTRGRPDHPDVGVATLLDEPVIVAVPPGHRLAHRESVSLRELADDQFVQLNRAMHERCFDGFLDRCARYGFEPEMRETEDIAMVQPLVMSGAGVALMPESALTPFPAMSRARVRHETAAISAVWVKGHRPPLLDDLLECAQGSAVPPSPNGAGDIAVGA